MSRVEPGSDAFAPQRFDVIYRTHFDPLLAYAIRRTDQPADAADVVAETFLVAWRRQAEMPGGEETRLWLFGVARKVLANARRGAGRRDRLGERLRQSLSSLPEPDPTGAASTRLTVRAAMDRLGDALIRDADPYASVRDIDLSADGQSLLEEIMLKNVTSIDVQRRRIRRLKWIATGVAAASIAIAVGIATVRLQPSSQPPPVALPSTQPSQTPTESPQIKFAAELIKAAEQHPRYILTAPGWAVQGVEGLTAGSGEVSYQKGEQLFAISWLPASEFHAHEISRSDQGVRAQPVEIDGADGSMYDIGLIGSPDRQFFVLLPPVGGAFVEIRTTADWNRDDFLSVLGTVRSAGVTEWLSSLPADVVSSDDVPSKVDDVLRGVPLPPGFDKSQFDNLGTNDSYQFGAAVFGQVVCDWLDFWTAAKQSGRDDEVQEARDALGTARDWPALAEMQTKGGYPDVVWQITDAVAAGEEIPKEVQDYRAALGAN